MKAIRVKHATGTDRPGWPEGASYRYRRGRHELSLLRQEVTDTLAAEIERAAAQFALVVDGPWIVFCYRFGDASSWSVASPFNWHTLPRDQRVLPADVEESRETGSRLASILWIRLVEASTGAVRARRAVVLGSEFTRALHEAIREQARESFSGAVADRSLAWLHHEAGGLLGQAVATTRCGPASSPDAPRSNSPAGRSRDEVRSPARRAFERLRRLVAP